MRRWINHFLCDEAGFVSGPEWAIVATILVLGAITGLIVSRQTLAPDAEPPPLLSTR
jgi:hypothetical protein